MFTAGIDVSGNVSKDLALAGLATIQGKTTDATGVPVGGVKVSLSTGAQSSQGAGNLLLANAYFELTSDSQGNYSVPLPPTTYYISVTPPANSVHKSASSTLAIAGDTSKNLPLGGLPYTISGRLTLPTGSGLSGTYSSGKISTYADPMTGALKSSCYTDGPAASIQSSTLGSDGSYSVPVEAGSNQCVTFQLMKRMALAACRT